MTRATQNRAARHRRRLSLIGVTAIVAGAAVGWIAFTANSGLPWQSRYEITADVRDAQRLIDNADVRIGGVRVGQVLDVDAFPARGGRRPYARLRLALDPDAGPLPADTRVQVRPASVLGLTYVDLRPGRSARTVGHGGALGLANSRPTVDLTDLFQVFDHSSARRFQSSLDGLSTGFAGRGADLNRTLTSLAALLPPMRSVARTLAAGDTRLGRFLSGYAATSDALGPVSPELARLVGDAATTFQAAAADPTALAGAIDATPPAESAVTQAFIRARPALDGLARLAVDLRPAGRALPASLDQINTTLDAGTPALRRLPRFSGHLRTALVSIDRLSRDPNTTDALRKLPDLVRPTNQVLEALTPAQVQCNMLAGWGISFSGTFSAIGAGEGPSMSNLILRTAGADLEPLQNARPSRNLGINPVPRENYQECEAGNEPFDGSTQQLNNPPSIEPNRTRLTTQPPGVRELARRAGLYDPIEGAP